MKLRLDDDRHKMSCNPLIMKNIIINNNNAEIKFNPAFRRNVFFPREKKSTDNHGKKKRERKKNFERNVSK